MQTFYMGIDASKGYADFTILDYNKEIVEKNFQLDDTPEGQEQLQVRTEKYFQDNPETIIYSGIESTGGYENNWYNYIKEMGRQSEIKISRLNPYMVLHNSKAAMQRIGTDKQSAFNIAECLIDRKDKILYNQEDRYYALKRSWTHITLLIKQKVQLMNQLDSYMYESVPELLSYCQSSKPKWVMRLLEKYPTSKEISEADMNEMAKLPYITIKRAKKIIDSSKKRRAKEMDPINGITIKSIVTQIMSIERAIEGLKKEVRKKCNLEEIQILKSLKGIGIDSAIGLYILIENINRFNSAKKLASFFGVHPVFKKSGDKASGFRMSKKGNSGARKILYMIAINAIRCNPCIKKIYQGHLNKGMANKAAIGAVMHKITRIIYGMLKNNQKFNPQADIENSIISMANKINISNGNNPDRRFQSYDSSAPISRSQSKKRKEQEKLQKV